MGAVLIVAAVVASCGSTSTTDSQAGGATVTTIVESTSVRGLEILGLEPGADPAMLVVTAAAVPTGTGPCEVEVVPSLEYEADRIYLTLHFSELQITVEEVLSDGGHRAIEASSATDGCELLTRPIEVALDGPLAGRSVVTQNPMAYWRVDVDGTYRRCVLPACDPETGESPASAACGDSTLPDAVRRGDVPRRASIDVRACEMPWAVVDIDIGAGACPATGEPGNPCAGLNIDRSYWKASDGAWEVLAYSSGPGCGDVLDVLPELPERLCAELPPVG